MGQNKDFTWFLQNIKTEHIRAFIYTLITLPYIAYQLLTHHELELPKVVVTTAACASILLIISEVIARRLSRYFQNKFEDRTKLTDDYDNLMKKYDRVNLIEYAHVSFPGEEIAFRAKNAPPFQFEFTREKKNYEVPKQIKDKSSQLMKAHDCSKIYNNINVRLEDCQQVGDIVKLTYSKTMYYDLLVTNRAMDYPLESEKGHTVKSIRQIYEPGPFLSPLSESKLSNHLGFNGFVELADGQIIFVLRNADVSIGKRLWSSSVNASYKAKYGLNDKREMSARYMGNAIRREIQDELKIEIGGNERLENCIFAFYRDLVEGGKPHFVFYYRVSDPKWTRAFFQENFRREHQKHKAKQKRRRMTKEEKIKDEMIVDGENFEFLSLKELKNSAVRVNQLVTPSGKPLPMQSDGSVSLALLMKYLTGTENPAKTLVYSWLLDNIRVESAQMPMEKRLSADGADRLAQVLVKILWGETSVEDAAYSLDDLITAEALQEWKNKAETEFESALKNSPAWIYKGTGAKLSKRDDGKNTNGTR